MVVDLFNVDTVCLQRWNSCSEATCYIVHSLRAIWPATFLLFGETEASVCRVCEHQSAPASGITVLHRCLRSFPLPKRSPRATCPISRLTIYCCAARANPHCSASAHLLYNTHCLICDRARATVCLGTKLCIRCIYAQRRTN